MICQQKPLLGSNCYCCPSLAPPHAIMPCPTAPPVPAAPAAADGQDHVLAIYTAKSPFGPWKPHLNGSFAAESATTMGVFIWRMQLHRLGRTCQKGVCGGVEVLQASGHS